MPAQSKHCRKRPAANNGAQPVPKRVLPHRVDWKNGLEHAPPQPDWEGELVRLFAEELSQIKASLGEEETIVNVWSDCGGMVTEMFSLRRMASKVRELTGVKFKAKLFCACEQKPELRSFIVTNHAPKHMAKDMLDRDWLNKSFKCVESEDPVRMPAQGIDIYVCGFPCGPWTPPWAS